MVNGVRHSAPSGLVTHARIDLMCQNIFDGKMQTPTFPSNTEEHVANGSRILANLLHNYSFIIWYRNIKVFVRVESYFNIIDSRENSNGTIFFSVLENIEQAHFSVTYVLLQEPDSCMSILPIRMWPLLSPILWKLLWSLEYESTVLFLWGCPNWILPFFAHKHASNVPLTHYGHLFVHIAAKCSELRLYFLSTQLKIIIFA